MLLPKQILLKNYIAGNDHSYIGYGGARGGAKSFAVREIALFFGFMKRLRCLIFRRYFNELLANHINPLFQTHPELRPLFNKSEKILYDGGGFPVLQFGYADSEDDIYKFQGTEYDIIFIDEATRCSESQINFLRTVNRSTGSGFRPKMVFTMNPGGVSHYFLKRIFIDREYKDNEQPGDYVFIQSHLWDNYLWVKDQLLKEGVPPSAYYRMPEQKKIDYCLKYSDYAKALSGLPEEIIKAYLYGDWEVFGGMFFKGFSRKKSVVEPFEIPSDWLLTGSLDPGYSSPLSFGINAMNQEGKIYRVYTYYEKQRSPVEHLDAILNLLRDSDSPLCALTRGRELKYVTAGLDAFAKKERYSIVSNELTFDDLFRKSGIYLTRALTNRRQGWWLWKGLLGENPSYFVFSQFNDNLLYEIESAVSDRNDPEDLLGKGNDKSVSDHALDEQRYALMSMIKPAEKKSDHNTGRTLPDYELPDAQF